jgi:hypothetical protein
MPTNPPTNEDRLRRAEVITVESLPEDYQAVVDGLTPDEVDVIIAVKTRLAYADLRSGGEPGPDGLPRFVMLMPF